MEDHQMERSVNQRIAELFKRVGNLLEQGVPLLRSLETISSEADENDRELLGALMGLVRTGETFSRSLLRMEFLSQEILDAVQHGEEKGQLDRVLKSLAAKIESGSPKISAPPDIGKLLETVTAQNHQVLRKVNRLLINALDACASDLHIEPTDNGGRVRYRIDGVLKEQPDRLDPSEYRAIVSRIKEMAALDPVECDVPQDGRILMRKRDSEEGSEGETGRMDLRVSVCPFVHGEKVVIRFLDRNAFPAGFERIRVSSEKIATIRRWLSSAYGVILVSGPTGSGKTTTLYLMLREIADRKTLNVVSIEDPVEYLLPNVFQMQINPVIGLTFPAALRSVMRQDPDVVCAGEIRNSETATLLVQMAQTGHLVLSQMHARSAVATLNLVRDLGVPAHVLRETVVGVISQRLVRRLCENCKIEETADARRSMPEILWRHEGPIYRASGCPQCHDTGYKGRDVIMELLDASCGLKSALDGASVSGVPGTDEAPDGTGLPGFRSMLDDAYERVIQGTTSFAEISRVAMA